MQFEREKSLHEIGPPFNFSGGAMIHRFCTGHIIRECFSDKIDTQTEEHSAQYCHAPENKPACCRPVQASYRRGHSHKIKRDLALGQEVVPAAQVGERSQTFLLPSPQTESEMLTIVAGKKPGFKTFFGCDQAVEMGQILVAQGAQPICNRFRIDNFRPNKPKRINKRKIEKSFPLLTKVPELKLVFVLQSKTDCLIADEKSGTVRADCRRRPRNQARS